MRRDGATALALAEEFGHWATARLLNSHNVRGSGQAGGTGDGVGAGGPAALSTAANRRYSGLRGPRSVANASRRGLKQFAATGRLLTAVEPSRGHADSIGRHQL